MPKGKTLEFIPPPLSAEEVETRARAAVAHFKIPRSHVAWPVDKEKRDRVLEKIREGRATGSYPSEVDVMRAVGGKNRMSFRSSLGAWTGRVYAHGGREVLYRMLEILEEEERTTL